ncbi:MAG TPA: ATP-binding cassette domain-containing protein [Terrimesophilobacter sp.]|uniref:ABC transporter ATP-binding protein n=1 Tax=Terrimesophilobacter sp. TaxID=2906435 RepID=UPI002F921F97
MTLLDVRDLTKVFSSRQRTIRALDGVSLRVEAAKTVAVVGESGSGKSTLGSIVAGLQQASTGEILFRQQTLTRASWRGPIRREVQMVFQNPYQSLNPKMRIETILAEPLALLRNLKGAAASARIDELLDLVGLPRAVRKRLPGEMSGGQQQRVAIARALAPEPDLIVLDEPTSGLDQSVRGRTVALLKDLQREKQVAYLFITHDIEVARSIAHDMIVMNRGLIVESGTARQVLEDPRDDYTRALLDAVPSMDPTVGRRGAPRLRSAASVLPTEPGA